MGNVRERYPKNIKIEAESLLLRQLFPDDVTLEYASWLNDIETNKFLEARHQAPFAVDDVKKFVSDCLERKRHHWGIFVDGRHVGNVSCSLYSHMYRWADISNLIGDKKLQHSNVAKLALAGALEYLFNVRGYHRISAGTYNDHFSGIALLTNLGFKKEALLRDAAMFEGRFQDIAKFSILEDEWRQISKRFPSIKVEPPPWENHRD